MNGVLTSEERTVESCLKIINETPKMEGLNLAKVSTKQQYLWQNPTKQILMLEKIFLKNQKN